MSFLYDINEDEDIVETEEAPIATWSKPQPLEIEKPVDDPNSPQPAATLPTPVKAPPLTGQSSLTSPASQKENLSGNHEESPTQLASLGFTQELTGKVECEGNMEEIEVSGERGGEGGEGGEEGG